MRAFTALIVAGLLSALAFADLAYSADGPAYRAPLFAAPLQDDPYVDPLDPDVEIDQPKGVPVFIESGDSIHKIEVELAVTDAARARGLMFRDALPQGKGMLFVYPRVRRMSFWMRNTRIPLDIIFIRINGKIANIVENAEPMTDDPRRSLGRAIAVLELAGGEAERLGLKAGDIIRHPLLNNALESQLGEDFSAPQPEVQ